MNKMSLSLMIIGISIILGAIGLSLYGLYLAFSASLILGIIILVVEPSPFILGLCALFGKDIAAIIQAWIHFPI